MPPSGGSGGMLIEHWWKAGSQDAPDCRCGKRMKAFNTIPIGEPIDAHLASISAHRVSTKWSLYRLERRRSELGRLGPAVSKA